MSKEQEPDEEPLIEDMVFDLAWRICTEAAEDAVLSDETFPETPTAESQKEFNKRMDEIWDSDAFTAELDAMQNRIEDALVQQRCLSCGGPIDDDHDELIHGRN